MVLTGDATLLTALDVPAPSVDIMLELREPTPLVTGALRVRAELTSLGGSPSPYKSKQICKKLFQKHWCLRP